VFERNVHASGVVLVLAALVVAAAAFALGGLMGGAAGYWLAGSQPNDQVEVLRSQNEALRQELDKMQQALEEAQSAEPFRETTPDTPEETPEGMPQEIPEGTPEETPEAVPQEMPEGIPEEMPQIPLIERPFLGIRYMPLEEGADGAEVVIVDADSPAEQAGLQEGDLITAVDSVPVTADRDLRDLILEYEPGDQVEIEYQRAGETRTVTVRLGARLEMQVEPQEFQFELPPDHPPLQRNQNG
jgi:C-terminal processing protease CtpA/Prc